MSKTQITPAEFIKQLQEAAKKLCPCFAVREPSGKLRSLNAEEREQLGIRGPDPAFLESLTGKEFKMKNGLTLRILPK